MLKSRELLHDFYIMKQTVYCIYMHGTLLNLNYAETCLYLKQKWILI